MRLSIWQVLARSCYRTTENDPKPLFRLSDLSGVCLPLLGPIAGGKALYQQLGGCL